MFSAERCDNAKLLKGIPYDTGLCGTLTNAQIGNLDFTTCANKVTIQFKTAVQQVGITFYAAVSNDGGGGEGMLLLVWARIH